MHLVPYLGYVAFGVMALAIIVRSWWLAVVASLLAATPLLVAHFFYN